MALQAINTILAEVSDLFDGLVTDGSLAANLDHPPLSDELEGKSPVHSLHYEGSEYTFHGNSISQAVHQFRSTLYINRRAHGNANTEALLGGLVTKIVQAVRNDVTGTTYDELTIGQRVRPVFVEIDGVPYRVAEIILTSVNYA